jgi:RNase H-fold protein (predicted Holliday junction resolvase)
MKKSREAGKKNKKRREMEDAYAAAVILQNFLDNLV